MLGELESNRAAVEATIDQEMGGLRQLLNDRIDTRTAELQAALAQEHGQRRTALETQRADVAQQHAGQLKLCTDGKAAIQQGDLTVLKLLSSVQGELKAAASSPALMAEQTKGMADKQMTNGTWVHVSGHGVGKCVGYKSNWTGPNDHTSESLALWSHPWSNALAFSFPGRIFFVQSSFQRLPRPRH